MKKILLLFIIIGIVKLSYSRNLDSLWKVYNNKNQADTNRLNAIQAIAWQYRYNNPDTAILFAEKQLNFANSNSNLKKWSANALNIIGMASANKGSWDKAIEYYLKTLEIFKEIGNKKGIGNCYNNIGIVYQSQSDYPKSLEYYLKALKIREEIKDKKGIAICYGNIGTVYAFQANYSKALEYYLKDLKIAEEIGDKYGMATCYTCIGNVYQDQSNHPKILEYYLKGLKIYEEINDKQGMGICYVNIGIEYKSQFNYSKAIEYYSKAAHVFKEIDDMGDLGACYGNMGLLYNNLSDFNKAIQYSDSALKISKELKDIENERYAYQGLAIAYSQTGKYKDAFENHVKFKQLTDSIFNTENSKQLGDMKTKFEVEKKEAELKLKAEAEEAINKEEKKRQRFVIYAVVGILFIVMIFSIFLYRRFKITQKQKTVIEEQKTIVEQQKHEVEKQKHLVEEHQKEIIDSITYAKRLQQAILPSADEINKYLPDNFLYYQPKDIVAGDFYWMEHKDNLTLIAAADSTGHGVPGAMVSVVCSNALNRAVNEFGLRDTGKILDKTRELVLETFAKSGEEIKDGMDISICRINSKTNEVQWSGANNQLWYIKKEGTEMLEIKADKQPIGKTDNPKPFTTHTLELQKGDTLYLMTDGYPDQFGGEKGKKFKYKQLEENLVVNSNKTLVEQKNILSHSFHNWKGNLEQVDDVTIIGIRV